MSPRVVYNDVAIKKKGEQLMTYTWKVDATIINAPSSTKNAEKARDPEMHQTKKGNEWKFPKGMSERVAVASLVYGAMMGKKDEMDAYCDHYRVTIEVERLEGAG
jgi:hypothetical protein